MNHEYQREDREETVADRGALVLASIESIVPESLENVEVGENRVDKDDHCEKDRRQHDLCAVGGSGRHDDLQGLRHFLVS